MRWIGVGYRSPLNGWLEKRPQEVECLEITAEHFFDGGESLLSALSQRYPLFVHGLGLSLGTPGTLCQSTLDNFVKVATIANAQWVSEHIAFTRTDEVDLGHLNPVPWSRRSLAVIVDHVAEVAERCGKPVILENITSDLQVPGCYQETEFLNLLCETSSCGLLLDITNLFINSKNHGYDAVRWLHELDPQNIVQLHVVGYSKRGNRYRDYHSERIQPEIIELLQAVLEFAPSVQAVILERDQDLDDLSAIASELQRLQRTSEPYRSHNGGGSITK